jgi:hypothetical protein
MKTRMTLAMACFIGFILCSTVAAYMPALIVRECPHCQAHVVEEQTIFGTAISAVLYTDGKSHSPKLPKQPLLVKCPVCSGLFWVLSAKRLKGSFEAAKNGQKVLAPSEKELLDYLEKPESPEEWEVYLRLRAWWTANDAWRWKMFPKPVFSNAQVKNLNALSEMLDESKPGHRIVKAEIARELGKFDECQRLLTYQFDKDYDWAVEFIKKLAEKKERAVKPFERTE